MKYDLYFHNDFDGRASAAVMLAFLRSRGDEVEHFTTVDFHLQAEWLKDNFFKDHKLFKGKRNPAIVVDFLFHPKAAGWFDHHITTFKKPEWKKRFKPDAFHVLEPSYVSCCHVVYASLRSNFGWKPPAHIAELVKWADIIDGAGFANPKQTIELKDAALQVDAFIDATKHDPKLAAWMVEMLAERPLKEIAALPKVKAIAKKATAENLKALRFYKKNMKVFGNATFIDLTRAPNSTLRYASYSLYPKLQYAVRLARKGNLYHIGIGANPWKKENTIHIGKLLGRYGGGGHKGAGAVDFPSLAEARAIVPEVLALLNKE